MKYFEYEDNTLTLDFKSEIAKNFYNDYLTFKCSFDISLDFLNQENYFNFNILEKEYKKLLKEFESATNYLKDKYPEIIKEIKNFNFYILPTAFNKGILIVPFYIKVKNFKNQDELINKNIFFKIPNEYNNQVLGI